MKRKHHGEIRQSQLITTYGPGAMVDLPKQSVVIGGLELWVGADTVIHEQRLADKVAKLLNVPRVELRLPPALVDSEEAPPTGVGTFLFPEWFVVQVPGKRRPLVNIGRLEKGKFTADDRRKYGVVPVRFVQACIRGHLSDIEWHGFAHTNYDTTCHRQLWIEERGASGDLADIWIGCECGVERSMAQATRRGTDALGFCRGQRPWLGARGGEKCGGMGGKLQPSRLLIRSASDEYFSQQLRVIALPDRGDSASSIRERIYAGDEGYGILLYTGSSDSDGTLGGLVEAGKRIEKYLEQALELGRLCSNDPVCSQHSPDHAHEEQFLNGAACHGCLLLAETSCERRNEFLDRTLVIPTVESLDAEFFREEA